MQMGPTGDRTAHLQVGGRPLYPSATAVSGLSGRLEGSRLSPGARATGVQCTEESKDCHISGPSCDPPPLCCVSQILHLRGAGETWKQEEEEEEERGVMSGCASNSADGNMSEFSQLFKAVVCMTGSQYCLFNFLLRSRPYHYGPVAPWPSEDPCSPGSPWCRGVAGVTWGGGGGAGEDEEPGRRSSPPAAHAAINTRAAQRHVSLGSDETIFTRGEVVGGPRLWQQLFDVDAFVSCPMQSGCEVIRAPSEEDEEEEEEEEEEEV
ncbi:unnamed protein product [Pleuronectes platessa]|uniref:Uncharacterized protein n=1 Tax=Pleuronectes platessa TaxID=8262 RepID=A0A9N7W009_PLEPL|nr:unnamed protein product [Pleuronectes platessa]